MSLRGANPKPASVHARRVSRRRLVHAGGAGREWRKISDRVACEGEASACRGERFRFLCGQARIHGHIHVGLSEARGRGTARRLDRRCVIAAAWSNRGQGYGRGSWTRAYDRSYNPTCRTHGKKSSEKGRQCCPETSMLLLHHSPLHCSERPETRERTRPPRPSHPASANQPRNGTIS